MTLFGNATLGVWPGRGDGTVGAVQAYMAMPSATGMAAANFDLDGRIDVAAIAHSTSSSHVLVAFNRGSR